MSGAGPVLWTPSDRVVDEARLTAYRRWLEATRGLRFADYEALHRWSVTATDEFWASVWSYFQIQASQPFERVLRGGEMPGAEWFPGARLNYAEHVLRGGESAGPAILAVHEGDAESTEISWTELRRRVASVAAGLRGRGVQRGDRVAIYLPNIPEATIAILACASMGAIAAICSPDFGARSVVARFSQLNPRILIATDSFRFGGRVYDRSTEVEQIRKSLPSLEYVVTVARRGSDAPSALQSATPWEDLEAVEAPLAFEHLPFDHPLWVLYTSGTTGRPKGIVHGHGGIVLEHHKALGLHGDLGPGDRAFLFTSTSWMAWNFLVGSLMLGATIVQYDGSPTYPVTDNLWRVAAQEGVTWMGMGSAYVTGCEKSGLYPGRAYDLHRLRAAFATGSALPPHAWHWVYKHVKQNLWLSSPCGGTEVCTTFFWGSPALPVRAGEMQCRCLGVAAESWDDNGIPVVGSDGEFVVTRPMPSMPLQLWGDTDGTRYRETYFARYRGAWHQGDRVTLNEQGGVIVHGRSDATLNRAGVRMGSADIYDAVEALPEIADSLVAGVERENGAYYMPLFVVLRDGAALDTELRASITETIRRDASPRHVPDEIIAAPAIPRNRVGKKLEVPIKRLLMGVPVREAVEMEAVADPETIDFYLRFATRCDVDKRDETGAAEPTTAATSTDHDNPDPKEIP